eukprot:scaffold31098_cov169-Isochrysis_galbana.AAC.1
MRYAIIGYKRSAIRGGPCGDMSMSMSMCPHVPACVLVRALARAHGARGTHLMHQHLHLLAAASKQGACDTCVRAPSCAAAPAPWAPYPTPSVQLRRCRG